MEIKSPPKPTNMKCKHCDYEWVTLSQMKQVTCPSCLLKTERIKDKQYIDNLRKIAKDGLNEQSNSITEQSIQLNNNKEDTK